MSISCRKRVRRLSSFFLSLCCIVCSWNVATVAAAASTTTSVDTATLRSMGLSRREIKEIAKGEAIIEEDNDEVAYVEEEVNDEDDEWKTNAEWWKDPLSMFSDDEDGQVGKEESPVEEEIDESISIIGEAESLGDDIVEDKEEVVVVDASETAVGDENQQIEEEPSVDVEPTTEVPTETIKEPETVPEEPAIPTVEESVQKVSKPEHEEKEITAEKEIPNTQQTRVTAQFPKEATPVKPKEEEPTARRVIDIEPKSSTGSSSSSSASPLALVVPLLPRFQGIQSALTGVPVVQLAASAVLAKFCFDSVKSKRATTNKRETTHDNFAQSLHDDGYESEAEDIFEDQFVGVGEYSDEEDEDDYGLSRTEATEQARKQGRPVAKEDIDSAPRSSSVGRAWMQGVKDRFARTPDGERIPPARELYRQVENLQKSLSKVESERDAMEKEYETASYQLQETQTELSTLQSSARYLKAQLRDNEDVMNKAIRAEQRKARGELSRMKAAMVGILEKERRAMREELKRRTNELRSLLVEVDEESSIEEEER